MMRSSAALLATLLVGAGCQGAAKKAAEERQKEENEVAQRATAAATQNALKAIADDDSRRRDEAQQLVQAKKLLRDLLEKSPATFVTVDNLEMTTKAGRRHLDSVSLTNNSKFVVTDVLGTLDLHGDSELPGTANDVVASVPIELTGSIAPGASMVFSEQLHTLSGGNLVLPSVPYHASFTVTGIRSIGGDEDSAPKDAGS